MAYYYYLVAQLPCLVFGQQMPMSAAAFRELAKPQLNARDAALFDMVSLDPPPPPSVKVDVSPKGPSTGGAVSTAKKVPASGSPFVDGWREWEWTLRLNLAKERAIKAQRENIIPADPPVIPTDAVALAHRAIAVMDSPLEAEVLLDRARWDAIDALSGPEFFSNNMVFAYMLKLLILQRHTVFQTEKGFSEYKSLYASILESAEPAARVGEST